MAETHKRYDCNSSHVLSQSFATEQWQFAIYQIQRSQRWVELKQHSVPNQCSNIRSFSVPSLSAHAKFDKTRHPKPCVLARWDFYFNCARIVTISQIWLLLERDAVKKIVSFFLNIWLFLEAVGTCYQTGVFALISCWKVLLGIFRQCLVYFLKRYLANHRRIKATRNAEGSSGKCGGWRMLQHYSSKISYN